MSSRSDDSKGALAALTELVRASAPPSRPARMAMAFDHLRTRLEARQARRRWALRSSLVLATGALGAVLLWVTVTRVQRPTGEPAPLGYTVEGGSVIDGGYVRESGSAGVRLAFAEGSEFSLRPGSRGRVRMVDGHGASLAIEQGEASFRITPRLEARWKVDVGPFLVTVKGTVFSVNWDPSRERFELRLQHGRVVVTGPVSGGEIALRAGQRLLVNLPKAETTISEFRPGEPWSVSAPPAPEGSVSSKPEPAVPSSRAPTPPGFGPAGAKSERRWAEAIASGQWERVLLEAERAGIKTILNNASSEDLFALADAARYRRHNALATQALLAERRRFPESTRALDATFLLGRLEEASNRGSGRALRWYDEYLTHAPDGTYASEALGRKMMVTNSRDGASRARPLAEEYLRRFPNGTYAGAAQALRRSP